MVRRTGVGLPEAVATTVLLRAADVVSLAVIGTIALPGLITAGLGGTGRWVLAVVGTIGVAALAVLAHLRSRDSSETVIRLPDAMTVVLVILAWPAEAVVVWRVAQWFDITLGPQEAIAVLAAAVSVQLVAVTPGGVGTYEAAGAAALVAIGVAPATALAVAVLIHTVKTVYSLLAGVIALVHPEPTIVGRLRMAIPRMALPRDRAQPIDPGYGPVVLFLPAHNEGPRVADVVARAPERIGRHPVVVVVVDDGSTDGTGTIAATAGATVISHGTNRGLGAAVRTGIEYCRQVGAAAGAFCDADGEYDPAELATVVSPILAGEADYVVGSRFTGTIDRMRWYRRLGNRLLTRWVRFITRAPVTDGQSGFRGLSPRALAAADIAHDYNYAQVLTIDLLSKGFAYHEVSIGYAFRRSGRSFVRLDQYTRQVIPTVWRQLNPGENPVTSEEEQSWKSDTGSTGPAPLSSPVS